MFKSLLITVLAVSRAIALDVTATFSPSASVVKDRSVSLQCSWRAFARETALTLTINFNSGSGLKSFYSYVINGYVTELADYHRRLSEDKAARSSTSMTMIIHNTQCLDEGNYYCLVTYFNSATSSVSSKNNSQALYINVPPKPPAFTTVPPTEIPEGTFINATCSVNLGRPGNGSIQWKYYSNGVEITSSITTKLITLQSGDDVCKERRESTSLVANRTFQNLSLACYFVNTDFPVTQPDCTNDNLCSRTDTISILYSVSGITVNSAPQSMNYEGGTTTLTCYADGNPKPSYTWTKEDDVNRTFNVIQDGDGSKIVLANLRLDLDDGTYTCKASNVVLGTLYTISSEVNVNVVTMTTTYRTTKTSTTSGFSTNVTKAVIADASQTSDVQIGIIIAGTIAVVLVIVLVSVISWYCFKKKGKCVIRIYFIPRTPKRDNAVLNTPRPPQSNNAVLNTPRPPQSNNAVLNTPRPPQSNNADLNSQVGLNYAVEDHYDYPEINSTYDQIEIPTNETSTYNGTFYIE